MLAALAERRPVRRLAAALHNDLEQAAFDLRPDLAALIVEGVDAGALRGLVSGSGPTCVFLCESADHARSVAGDAHRRPTTSASYSWRTGRSPAPTW